MATIFQYCLQQNRDHILEDLNPRYVLPFLVEHNVLTVEENNYILSEATPKKQAGQLLELISKKGEQAFDDFLRSLKYDDNYPWLSEKLETSIKPFRTSRTDQLDAYEILKVGGVPPPTKFLVDRKENVEKLRDMLKELSQQPRGWVVIHGMMGCGKSTLAAEALRDITLLSEHFPGGVFWTAVGQVEDTAFLIKLQILCDRIEGEQHSLPLNVDVAIRRIEKALSRKKKRSLIILDDVWTFDVVKKFDFGGHVMVTTQDRALMREISAVTYFPLNPEFSLMEAKILFSKYVDVSIEDLPEVVDRIHEKCKGSPLALAVIGGSMANFGNSLERWEIYDRFLAEGKIGRIRHFSGRNEINDGIKLALNNLSEELKYYYNYFALFIEDIDIPIKVFEILWGKDRFEVEDILFALFKKSLLWKLELYNDDQTVCAVHDILLRYLKENIQDERLVEMHSELISQYMRYCAVGHAMDYSRLPDDGYIYYHLGYHLDQSRNTHLFRDIFLDLKFVAKKLKLCGPSDLIYDYKHYQQHFQHCISDQEDFIHFINENDSLLCTEDIDAVQVALLQPRSSLVRQQADVLVRSGDASLYCDSVLYFNWMNSEDRKSGILLSRKLHKGSVSFATFSPENDLIASVGEDTIIRVWDSSSGKEHVRMTGHEGKINCCVFTGDAKQLATASDDFTVRLWKLDYIEIGASKERGNWPRSGDNRKSVDSGRSSEDSDVYVDRSCFVYRAHEAEVLYCSFSNSDELVVSGDQAGKAMIWYKDTGQTKFYVNKPEYAVTSCCFSPDDEVIAISSDSVVTLWNAKTGDFIRQLPHALERVTMCCFSKEANSFFLISTSGLDLCKWNPSTGDMICTTTLDNDAHYITCCAISPNEELVATGSMDRKVRIWSLESHEVIKVLKGHSDAIMNVAYSQDGKKLLSAAYDGTVIIWDASTGFQENGSNLKSNLSVQFRGVDDLLVAVPDQAEKIQVFSGCKGSFISESIPHKEQITACCITPNLKYVFYGLSSGLLMSYDIGESVTIPLGKIHVSEITCCHVTQNGKFIITSSTDKTLNKFDLNGKCQTFRGHSGAVLNFKCFDGDLKILSCCDEGFLIVWEMSTGACILAIDAHSKERVTCCDVSRDGKLFVSVSTDKHMKIWHAHSGELCFSLNFHECLRSCCFFPGGDAIVVGNDKGEIWICKLQHQTSNRVPKKHDKWVKQIQVSDDGTQFVSVGDSFKWWNKDGRLLQTFPIVGSELCHVFASPAFNVFVSVDDAGILYILRKIEVAHSM